MSTEEKKLERHTVNAWDVLIHNQVNIWSGDGFRAYNLTADDLVTLDEYFCVLKKSTQMGHAMIQPYHTSKKNFDSDCKTWDNIYHDPLLLVKIQKRREIAPDNWIPIDRLTEYNKG